jgi:hypothetical protein
VNHRFAKALFDARERMREEGCQRRGHFVNGSTGVTLGPGGKVSSHFFGHLRDADQRTVS